MNSILVKGVSVDFRRVMHVERDDLQQQNKRYESNGLM